MSRTTSAVATAALLLAACSPAEPVAAPTPADSLLADHGLAGMEAPEVVEHLDRLRVEERPAELTASVRVDELLLSDATREVALDLPDDRFYLSVAPYVDETHDCFYHSLTTCKGELAGEDVQVRVVDDATGEVLVDDTRTTYDNGFVGLWLPRGIEGTVEISADGRAGAVPFATDDEGATCLTTLRLA